MQVDLPAADIIARMRAAGWSEHNLRDVLWTFKHKDGHKVVFVPTTGRIQVRVNLVSPQEERRGIAEGVWKTLVG